MFCSVSVESSTQTKYCWHLVYNTSAQLYTRTPSSCLFLVDGIKMTLPVDSVESTRKINSKHREFISNWKHSNWVRNFSFKMTTIQFHTFTRIFIAPMKMLRVQFKSWRFYILRKRFFQQKKYENHEYLRIILNWNLSFLL